MLIFILELFFETLISLTIARIWSPFKVSLSRNYQNHISCQVDWCQSGRVNGVVLSSASIVRFGHVLHLDIVFVSIDFTLTTVILQ